MSTQGLVVDSLGRSLGWPLLSPGWLFTQGIMSCVGKAGCQPVLMASVGVTWAKPQALQANLRCPGWSQSLPFDCGSSEALPDSLSYSAAGPRGGTHLFHL